MPDPRRAGAYTASDNALCGRGSGQARLGLTIVHHKWMCTEIENIRSAFIIVAVMLYNMHMQH